jgi:uridine kinase
VVLLALDSFYRELTPEELDHVERINFDHPDAFDFGLIHSTLSDMRQRKPVKIPEYDFKTCSRYEMLIYLMILLMGISK